MAASRLNLLFDADDTLWLNATLFDQAFSKWVELVGQWGADKDWAAFLFGEMENRGFRRGWYGSRRLEINMNAAARHLLSKEVALPLTKQIAAIVDEVRSPNVLIFAGVRQTLASLQENHNLLLVTMGEKAEQLNKLEGSGLSPFFSAVHVLADKTRSHYSDIVKKHRLERRDSWMIGNSLAKDIRPARAAGLRTCHLANGHDFGFGLPQDTIKADVIVSDFQELRGVFSTPPAP